MRVALELLGASTTIDTYGQPIRTVNAAGTGTILFAEISDATPSERMNHKQARSSCNPPYPLAVESQCEPPQPVANRIDRGRHDAPGLGNRDRDRLAGAARVP